MVCLTRALTLDLVLLGNFIGSSSIAHRNALSKDIATASELLRGGHLHFFCSSEVEVCFERADANTGASLLPSIRPLETAWASHVDSNDAAP